MTTDVVFFSGEYSLSLKDCGIIPENMQDVGMGEKR
jgi:hypothetical protein